jgi:hypothetical protein
MIEARFMFYGPLSCLVEVEKMAPKCAPVQEGRL